MSSCPSNQHAQQKTSMEQHFSGSGTSNLNKQMQQEAPRKVSLKPGSVKELSSNSGFKLEGSYVWHAFVDAE